MALIWDFAASVAGQTNLGFSSYLQLSKKSAAVRSDESWNISVAKKT